jgi:glutamate racemase
METIHALLPNEKTIYLADSKNALRSKSKSEIIALSMKTDFLGTLNCNCSGLQYRYTNAIQKLRAKYSIPFIGIEPAIKPAVTFKTQVIGILATREHSIVNSLIKQLKISGYKNN